MERHLMQKVLKVKEMQKNTGEALEACRYMPPKTKRFNSLLIHIPIMKRHLNLKFGDFLKVSKKYQPK